MVYLRYNPLICSTVAKNLRWQNNPQLYNKSTRKTLPLRVVRGKVMRESIDIIDNDTIEIKGRKYTSSESGLVFIIQCLIKEYDEIKFEYNRMLELQEKVKSIATIDGMAYVMPFIELSNRLKINRQTLMIIASRSDFDKYRTYVTKPRKHPALIITRNSLKLLYTYLNERSRIQFSLEEFKKLLREVING